MKFRIFDNGEDRLDRYTIAFDAHSRCPYPFFDCLASGVDPAGYSGHESCQMDRFNTKNTDHLGVEVTFAELPDKVKTLVKKELVSYLTTSDAIKEAVESFVFTSAWAAGEEADQANREWAKPTRLAAEWDTARFLIENADTLAPFDADDIGHDFLLTRNGHGAGFWDGDYGDVGDALTAACEKYKQFNTYVGDDGLVYAEGIETFSLPDAEAMNTGYQHGVHGLVDMQAWVAIATPRVSGRWVLAEDVCNGITAARLEFVNS